MSRETKLALLEKYYPRAHIRAFANGGYSLGICRQTILGSYLEIIHNTAEGNPEAKPAKSEVYVGSVSACHILFNFKADVGTDIRHRQVSSVITYM